VGGKSEAVRSASRLLLTVRPILGVIVAAGLLGASPLPAAAQVTRRIPRPPCLDVDSVMPPRVFAMGDRCFIEWSNALNRGDDVAKQLALRSLATVGGRAAVEMLRAYHDRSGDVQSRQALILAMATTGSEDDIAFLHSQVRGPFVGSSDVWPSTQAAAMTLGLLRVPAARNSLASALAQHGAQGFAGRAVQWALATLDRPPCADSVGTEPRELIRVVMMCNPPFLGTSASYRDAASGGAWQFTNGAWRHSAAVPGDTAQQSPVLHFVALVSPDSQRAIVVMGMRCGSLCGEGWKFHLRRDGRIWRLIAATMDWVS
jgi:hypothetical protein